MTSVREDAVSAVSIAEIVVADEPAAWRDAGFTVTQTGLCRIGSVTVRLAGRHAADDPGGLAAWVLRHADTAMVDAPGHDPLSLDGLATTYADARADAPEGAVTGDEQRAHPNGCLRIDHVVVLTPDLERTTAAFAAIGVPARRTREAGRRRDGTVTLQRFFRLGEIIVELVGPAQPSGSGPARFWGLAHVVADIDAAAGRLTGRISPVRDAVQPGRRIATLGVEGISVPTALMSERRA